MKKTKREQIAQKAEENNFEYIKKKIIYNFQKLKDLGYNFEKAQEILFELWQEANNQKEKVLFGKIIANGTFEKAVKTAFKYHFLSCEEGVITFKLERSFGSIKKSEDFNDLYKQVIKPIILIFTQHLE